MRSALGSLGMVLALAGIAGPAAAETQACNEIPSVPYTIFVPGIYCLKKNLQPSLADGVAITVNAHAATIDLNGFRIFNSYGFSTTAVGIHAVNKENLVVRNGMLRGFRTAVLFEELTGITRGNVVEDLIVDANWAAGIVTMGEGNTIRRCQALGIGSITPLAKGIEVLGEHHVVTGNLVGGFMASDGRGIITSGAHHMVLDNRVMGANHGLQLSSTTKYRDNVVSDTVTSYSGGIDIGNNN